MSNRILRVSPLPPNEPPPRAFAVPPGREQEIDFDAIWRRIRKHGILLTCIVLIPISLSFVYIRYGPKQYAAVATLEARPITPQPNEADVFGKVLSDSPVTGLTEEDIATTQAKLLHYDFLAKVAADPALQKALQPALFSAERDKAPQEVQITTFLKEHLQITRVRGTRLLDVSARFADPRTAALMANTFVNLLIEEGLSSRAAFTIQKIDGLDEDFRNVEARLNEAQRRVALYLLSMELQEGLEEARNEVKTLSGRYGEKHPKMKEALAIQKTHEEALIGELTTLRQDPTESTYWTATLGPSPNLENIPALQAETLLTGRYESLTSEVAALRSLNESLSVRLNEIRIANNRPDLDLRIAQPAVFQAARQVAPNKKLSVAAGLLLGMFLAFVTLLALGSSRARIEDEDDWRGATSLPLLGLVEKFPRHAGPHEVIEIGEENHPIAEQIRNLRSRLISPPSSLPHAMMVASALPGEGKSTLAAALALSLVRVQPGGVVLVELDLHRPSIHKALELPNFLGTSEVLTGRCALDDALTVTAGLMVLTGGNMGCEALHHLGGPSLMALIEALKRRFRRVIVDTPPVLGSADVRLIAPLCDEVLLVVNARSTPPKAVQLAEQEILWSRGLIRGGVLNQIPTRGRGRARPYIRVEKPTTGPAFSPYPMLTDGRA